MSTRPHRAPAGRCARAVSLRRLSLLALLAFLVLGLECDPKRTDFFIPDGIDGPTDTTPPTITNLEPPSAVVLNSDELCFSASDMGSGLDVAGMTARTSMGTSLPVQPAPTPGKFIVDIGSLSDGPHAVEVRVPDNAGNVSTATFDFVKDETRPSVAFEERPAMTGTSNAASVEFRFRGTITEPNLGPSMLEVRRRQGAECTPDDPLWPQGTGPGQVSANTAAITGNSFDITVMAFNGVPAGGRRRRHSTA